MNTTTKLIDIYHGDVITSFHDLYAAGILGCYIKATQGATYVDPNFTDNAARAASVGMIKTGYGFFVPDDDPVQQAQHLVNVANPKAGDLPLILDVETAGANVGANALVAAQEIKRLTGWYPWIYSGESFYGQYLAEFFPAADYNLIIANYSEQPKMACAMWQNSESGRLVGCENNVDTDIFFGSLADLRVLCTK